MTYHSYEPVQGHRLRYDPFGSIIAPRPIGWISTRNENGGRNLAPYSFFNAFNYKPPIVGFASVGAKDSLRNAERTGVFGWNMATAFLAEQVNRSSVDLAADGDEFDFTGLASVSADLIDAPLVEQSPVRFECSVTQVVQLKNTEAASIDTWLVLGDVVKVHISTVLLESGAYVTTAADPLLRGGGLDYFRIDEAQQFTMRRPSTSA